MIKDETISDIDDIRSSPAIELLRRLIAEGAQVRAFDPEVLTKAQAACRQLTMDATPFAAAEGADTLLIAREWNDFWDMDWMRIRDVRASALVFDERNLLDHRSMQALGFEYRLGRTA